MKYYQIDGKGLLSMVYPGTSKVFATLALFCAASLSFMNAAADEAVQAEELKKQTEQTAVIIVTDPDIAGAEDEEPDCE